MLLQWSPESTYVPKKAPSLLGEQKIPPRQKVAGKTYSKGQFSFLQIGGGGGERTNNPCNSLDKTV